MFAMLDRTLYLMHKRKKLLHSVPAKLSHVLSYKARLLKFPTVGSALQSKTEFFTVEL